MPTAAKHHWTTHRPPLSGAEAAALAAWCERAHDGESLGEVARELLSLPVVLRAAAALAALRTSLAVNDPDPEWQTPQRVARLLADYIERPGPDLADLESATGAVESNWNAVAGDSGHPEPTYQAATYAGWTVTCPDDPFNMVHALHRRREGRRRAPRPRRRPRGAAAISPYSRRVTAARSHIMVGGRCAHSGRARRSMSRSYTAGLAGRRGPSSAR